VTPWDTDLLRLVRNPATPPGVVRDKLLDGGLDVQSVWVVYGATGDNDSHHEWPVAAFVDKARADALCEGLNEWLKGRDIHVSTPEDRRPSFYSMVSQTTPPDDPDMQYDYTGVEYFVTEVPLRWE
jgi:hypothetical protein